MGGAEVEADADRARSEGDGEEVRADPVGEPPEPGLEGPERGILAAPPELPRGVPAHRVGGTAARDAERQVARHPARGGAAAGVEEEGPPPR